MISQGARSSSKSRRASTKTRRPNVQAKAQKTRTMRKQTRFQTSGIATSAASAYGTVVSTSAAIQQSSRGGHRVKHRELISGALQGSVGFVKQLTIKLNPGLAESFPWLSNVASQFEHYTIHSLGLSFVSTSATTETGVLIMSPEYDPSTADPSSETECTQVAGTVESPSWQSCRIQLDPKSLHPSGPKKFVRRGAVAGDVRLSDAGKVHIATTGQGGVRALGKIWMEYDVEFFKPQSVAMLAATPRTLSEYVNVPVLTYPSGVATYTSVSIVFDPLGIGTQTAASWTPPRGSYLVTTNFTATDTVNEAFFVDAYLAFNGTQVPSRFLATQSLPGATPYITGSNRSVLSFNGTTDSCAFICKLTGSTGVLTIPANALIVTFEVV